MESHTNSDLDLLKNSHLSIPGGAEVENNEIKVSISPKYKINRLALNSINKKFSKNKILSFSIKYDSASKVKFDILRGDIGFPEISIENNNNEVYRLKRGNFKDFIDRKALGKYQFIHIPLSSFIFHLDLKENIIGDNDFFESPISKINFDFLSGSTDICVHLASISIVDSNSNFHSLNDIFELERIADSKNYERLVTEKATISLSIIKNDIGKFLYPGQFNLSVHSNHQVIKKNIGDKKEFLSLKTPYYGNNEFLLKAEYNGKVFEYALNICRAVPKRERLSYFAGISDEFKIEKCHELGSGLFRIVINLRGVIQEKGSFRFPSGQNPFAVLSRNDVTYWIALKGIPKWMSKNGSSHDYYRYGPRDIGVYKQLMIWIFQESRKSNVKVVELWNEANVIHEWNDTFEALSEMCSVSEQARNMVYPDCKLASPSSTSWDFRYFEKLKDAGVYEHVDYMALHGYTYEPESAQEQFLKLENFLSSFLDNKLRAVITEIGFRVPTFSEDEQAVFLFLYSIYAFASPNVENIFWFRIQNPRYESLSSYDQNSSGGYAMVGYEGSYVRPAYAAFRYFSSLIENVNQSYFQFKYGVNSICLFENERMKAEVLINLNSEHVSLEKKLRSRLFDCFGNRLAYESLGAEKIIIVNHVGF